MPLKSNRLQTALAGLLLLPLVAFGQTTNITRPIEPGQRDLMSAPLVVAGGNAVSNILSSAPTGSFVYFWDADLQVWNGSQKTAKDWPGSDREVLPGESFFYEPAGAQTVVLTGTFPPSPATVIVPDSQSVLAFPFPWDVPWAYTSLSWLLPPGSTVAFWDRTAGAWSPTYTKAQNGSWDNAAATHILLAGDGFAVTQPAGSPDIAWTEFNPIPMCKHCGLDPDTNLVRTVGSNQWDLMSVPLEISPNNQFGLIATNAAVNSTVYFYDPAISNFAGGSKSSKGWSAAQSNRVVLPGESFFLKTPVETGHEISISGTVPIGPVTNQIHERWSALGYPYPVEVAWTDTSLSSNLPAGSLVYFWDLAGQRYDIYRKGPPAKGGWGPASNHVIRPGDGFFVRQPLGSTPFTWIE